MAAPDTYLDVQIDAAQNQKTIREILTEKYGFSQRHLARCKQHPQGILLDGQRVTVRTKVQTGQVLQIIKDTKPVRSNSIVAVGGQIEILYEDADLLIVNKPPHMATHPSVGHWLDSLCNYVAYYLEQSGQQAHIHPIGRLDYDTSGIVCIAKHSLAASKLERSRSVNKVYLALAKGIVPEEGEIHLPMGYQKIGGKYQAVEDFIYGKHANTSYKRRQSFSKYSLCEVTIGTGRMHQIRFHLSRLGFPLLGDPLYGDGRENVEGVLCERAMLHAYQFQFMHPLENKVLRISAPIPEDMQKLIAFRENA